MASRPMRWMKKPSPKFFKSRAAANDPVIVHVAALKWPDAARQLAGAGGRTFKGLLAGTADAGAAARGKHSAIVAAGGPTVGIRWPSHPFMQAVIRECGFPLAAPSANLSNQISPTNAEHVRTQLDGKIPLIVDGGQSQVGIESTVLDLTVSPPRILRPG